MECTEARALKPGFLSQMGTKTSSQIFCNDDVWCFNAAAGAVSEDFPVEELLNLDFSDKEFQDCEDFEEHGEGLSKLGSNNSSSAFSGGADDFDSLSTGNLTDGVEGLESLEWLSQFVDDSMAELPSLWPTVKAFTHGGGPVNPPLQENRVSSFPIPVPRKRRNKRLRSNGLPWSLVSLPLSSVDSTSAASSSSHGSSFLPALVFPPHPQDWLPSIEKAPSAKKPKRKPESESGTVSGRRCTHCQVQKTPQWRTGPLGPKTLCNACGVRFKSGRLLPEYRPACSPTFSQAVHSNSHRKVLEMRRMKEMTAAGF